MGARQRVVSKSHPMITNMTGFKCFSKELSSRALDRSNLSIGSVKLTRENATLLVMVPSIIKLQNWSKQACSLNFIGIILLAAESASL